MADKFNAGEVTMLFTGDDRAFQRTADNVEQSMKNVAGTAKASSKEVEGFIVNVRQFTLLYQFSSGLKAMGDAAEKFATEMRLGKAATGDLIEKVAEGIPIIGRFVEAGRAIREAITGEKAYTEVLKQQTEEQEKRVEAVNRYVDAVKELRRSTEDLSRGLSTPKGLGLDITTIFTGGERQVEDLPEKLATKYKKQFDDLADARKKASEKLKEAIDANRVYNAPAGPGGKGSFTQREEESAAIGDARQTLRKLDEQAAALRELIEREKDLSTQTIRANNVEQARNAVIDVGIKSLHAFGIEVKEFAKAAPKIHEVTRQAIAESISDFDKLRQKMIDLRTDFAHGFINEGLFKENDLKLKLDTAATIVEGFWKRVAPPTQVGLHFLDSILGAPVERVKNSIVDLAKVTADLFGGKAGKPKKPEDFRAQFVGLSGLGSRIQQAAGSLTADELAKKQLEAQQQTAKNTDAAAKATRELKEDFSKRWTPYAVVQ